MSSVNFLISIFFNLYIMVFLMRLWLEAYGVGPYNPLSQSIGKLTQPIVGPLQRSTPSIGRFNLGTMLFVYSLCVVKLTLLMAVSSYSSPAIKVQYLLLSLLSLLKHSGELVFWVLLIRSILSWKNRDRSAVEHIFSQITEPLLIPIRKFLPEIEGVDLSVLVVFVSLQFANFLLGDIVGTAWSIF